MNRRKKQGIILFLAAAMLFALSACAGAEEDLPEEVELSEAISGELLTAGHLVDNLFSLAVDSTQSLNPITTKSSLNQLVGSLVYDNLFEIDDNFNLSSRVLSDWYFVPDSGVWVLEVKEGVAMHDGSTLTGEDVAYSISRVFTQGCTFYMQRLGTTYVSGSDQMVYVMGEYANGLLPYRLVVPLVKQGSILDDPPVGSGPYRFSEDRQSLVKFDGYEDAENLPVDTIYLQQYTDAETLIIDYENGLVDLVTNDPTGIYHFGYPGRNEKRTYNTTNMHFIGFNPESDFFCYAQYRYAMTYLIDRVHITESVLDGFATPSALFIHPNSPLFDKELNDSYAYDPARARMELEKLGCRDLDADGMLEFALSGAKVEIDIDFLVCTDTATKVQCARRIAEDMQAAGIAVRLKEVSWDDYQTALKEGEYDMYYGEVAITPDWNLLPFLEEEGALNPGGWAEKDLETAVNAFVSSTDDTRPDNLKILNQTMALQSILIPVCFEKRQVFTHLGIVQGLTPSQYNIFHDFSSWRLHLDG